MSEEQLTEAQLTALVAFVCLSVAVIVMAIVVVREMSRLKDGRDMQRCYDCGKVATPLDHTSQLRGNVRDGRRRCRECDK